MSHDTLGEAFKNLFPHIDVWGYKKIDAHSIEITTPDYFAIWTYYGPKSWKLETK